MRDDLSSFHSFQPLEMSAVAMLSPSGPDQHSQCGVTTWSHSTTASSRPCEEHRERAMSSRLDCGAEPEVLVLLVLQHPWEVPGEGLVFTTCYLLVPTSLLNGGMEQEARTCVRDCTERRVNPEARLFACCPSVPVPITCP